TQANGAHLGQASDWISQTLFDCFDARDERGTDSSEPDQQNTELSFSRRDFRAFLYRHSTNYPPKDMNRLARPLMIHETRLIRTWSGTYESFRAHFVLNQFVCGEGPERLCCKS